MDNETQAEKQDTIKRLNNAISMQLQCSLWGLVLTTLWWIYAEQHIDLMFWQIKCLICSYMFFGFAIFYKNIAQALHTKIINTLTFFYYGILNFFKEEKIIDTFKKGIEGEASVEAKLKWCSIFNVFAIALLIAVTGGISSPFIAIYVMTYVLTLENVKKEGVSFNVLGLFVLCLLLAFIPQLISYFFQNDLLANIKTLNNNDSYQIIVAVGVLLGLLIPYTSRTLISFYNIKYEK